LRNIDVRVLDWTVVEGASSEGTVIDWTVVDGAATRGAVGDRSRRVVHWRLLRLVPCRHEVIDRHELRLLMTGGDKLGLELVVDWAVDCSYLGLVLWVIGAGNRGDMKLLLAVRSLLNLGLRIGEAVDRSPLGMVPWVVLARGLCLLIGWHRAC